MSAEFRRQLDILTDRNIAVRLGAPGALAVLCLQAPLIGAFIGLAWKGQEAVPQTYFVMAVAALWMGCLNACTAIVQERAVYARERMFDLDIGAYLLSKLAVLGALGAAQAFLMVLAQGRLMHLHEGALPYALTLLILSAASAAASGLGLVISSFAGTSQGAVIAVPILIIPQVLFSKVILQANIDNALPKAVERVTVTKWCYDSLVNIHEGATALVQIRCFGALAFGLAVFLAAAYGKLRAEEL